MGVQTVPARGVVPFVDGYRQPDFVWMELRYYSELGRNGEVDLTILLSLKIEVMKSLIVTIILLATIGVSAQGPVPSNGYWEVISNVYQPKEATVKFYDLANHLIYEEHVNGVQLDLNKRSTRRRLNRSLKYALVAWTASKEFMKDKGLVAVQFAEHPEW